LLPALASPFSTRLRSLEQAAREGSATGKPLRSPDAPPDPASSAGGDRDRDDRDAARRERDERIAHAGGGFGPAIIAQNLAEREGTAGQGGKKHHVDPSKTPPSLDMPSAPLPHVLTEQIPHAARRFGAHLKEAVEYAYKGEQGSAEDPSGAAAKYRKTQGMPPLGEADAKHRRLAEEMRRSEGM